MNIRHPFVAAALGAVLAWPAWAQTTPPAAPVPDTRSMIEALKPAANRSMRNLTVRQRPDLPAAAGAASAAPASVASTPTVAMAAASAVVAAPAQAAAASQATASVAMPAAATATAATPAMPAAAATATAAPPATPGAAPGPAPSLSLAIQFESNSSRVRPESGPVLGNLVAALQSPELKAVRFAIEGHTDAVGPAARNLALSQERADEVRLYLVALGVHPSRLKAVGKGASQPVNPLDPLSADNRRVRVVTLQ
jgi:outer membrane protein OmpA-like peptidoglycan-associated protein